MSDLEAWKRNHDASVNSGAAAAVLAFAGGVVSQGRIAVNDVNSIASGLVWFGSGVLSAAISNCLAYLTNRAFLEISVRSSRKWNVIGDIFQCATMIAVFASLLFFTLGLFEMRAAIGHLHLIDPPRSNCVK